MSGKTKKAKVQKTDEQPKTKRRAAGVNTTQQRVTEAPEALATAPGVTKPGSIRQTVMAMINQGNTTEEISTVLKDQFPGSKAAEKSGKHIAHYRALMKKASRTIKA